MAGVWASCALNRKLVLRTATLNDRPQIAVFRFCHRQDMPASAHLAVYLNGTERSSAEETIFACEEERGCIYLCVQSGRATLVPHTVLVSGRMTGCIFASHHPSLIMRPRPRCRRAGRYRLDLECRKNYPPTPAPEGGQLVFPFGTFFRCGNTATLPTLHKKHQWAIAQNRAAQVGEGMKCVVRNGQTSGNPAPPEFCGLGTSRARQRENAQRTEAQHSVTCRQYPWKTYPAILSG